MDYITAKEAAATWNVSDRQVLRLALDGRIPGARKFGISWMIPAGSAKPIDPRKARKLPQKEDGAYVFLTSVDLPKGDPDAALLGLKDALRPLAAADIAFRRGDPEPAKTVWRETSCADKTKLSAASLAAAAAISSGDYALYSELQGFLEQKVTQTQDERDKALLSLPKALVTVSMALPDVTPAWLKNGDFSLFPATLRPFLLYLYALHLRNIGDFATLRGVAESTLLLCERPDTFTWLDVYLGVLEASAAYAQSDAAEAERALVAAMTLGLPHGFIMPFADNLGDFGGLMEACLERMFPQYHEAVVETWGRSFKNWVRFHNVYSKENITTILTSREYQVARLLASGESYAGVSRRMNLSVGRIKNIQSNVYAKLHVGKRAELKDYIL